MGFPSSKSAQDKQELDASFLYTKWQRNILGYALSKYIDVDLKIEVNGPVKGALARAILAVLAVGIKHDKFVETPDFYRVCLPYKQAYEEELIEIGGEGMTAHDQYLYEHIADLAVQVSSSYNVHDNGYEAGRKYKKLTVFDKIGLQISYGDWTFCLTLSKKFWNVNYEFVKESKHGIYITNPKVEIAGIKLK